MFTKGNYYISNTFSPRYIITPKMKKIFNTIRPTITALKLARFHQFPHKFLSKLFPVNMLKTKVYIPPAINGIKANPIEVKRVSIACSKLAVVLINKNTIKQFPKKNDIGFFSICDHIKQI